MAKTIEPKIEKCSIELLKKTGYQYVYSPDIICNLSLSSPILGRELCYLNNLVSFSVKPMKFEEFFD